MLKEYCLNVWTFIYGFPPQEFSTRLSFYSLKCVNGVLTCSLISERYVFIFFGLWFWWITALNDTFCVTLFEKNLFHDLDLWQGARRHTCRFFDTWSALVFSSEHFFFRACFPLSLLFLIGVSIAPLPLGLNCLSGTTHLSLLMIVTFILFYFFKALLWKLNLSSSFPP